jgi:hypothetical protein
MAGSTSGAGNGLTAGASGVLSDPRQAQGMQGDNLEQDPKNKEDEETEEALVKKLWSTYDDARKFDENFRKQIAIDRRYAAGTSDVAWAVTTNLIGAFIDILVALLYARNPDVSVTKARQVDEENTDEMAAFAKTLEIVISHLWLRGKLKKAARKGVRSVLSNAEGWFKCTMVSEREPQPEVEKALNDAKETMERLKAQEKLLEDPNDDEETREAEIAEKQALMQELQEKVELAVNTMFVIDFVETQNMQVSTDINAIEDYLEADWIANEMFVAKDEALARCPLISAEELKTAKLYYQTAPKELTTRAVDNVLPQGMLTAESAQAFVSSTSTPNSPAFYRLVELWDRRDKVIRTMLDGVKKWAKQPYPPPYPTARFYPYFYFAFYEVDGQRHAQSLSWRLYKLQDEYSASRSNFRLTRERSIPGVLFNATMMDETEAKKLTEAKHQEYTGLKPSDPATPIADLFAPKPVAAIDMRVFDPTYILNDMERISGVQEALSAAISGPGNPKTATEANIQQSGTQARTTSNRDSLEECLTDMAQYTAQQALQCLSIRDVQRIAGKKAFWPQGMDIEDLFTMVEVRIEAGTTGRPRQQTDTQAWTTLLPIIKDTIQQVEQALATGNMPLANSLTELIKETMIRFGDESDVTRFIPKTPPPGTPGAGGPRPPIMPKVTVALKGELSPEAAATLVSPAIAADQPPPPPAPPEPGQAPVAPATPV